MARVAYLAVPGVGLGLAMALMGAPVAGAVVAAVSAGLFAIVLVRYRRLRRDQDAGPERAP